MPKRLERIAKREGHRLYTEQVTVGGKGWKYHANQLNTYSTINSEPWDYVVLQARSDEPLQPSNVVESNTVKYGQQLIDSVRYHWPKAKIMLFMTWGYKNGIVLNQQHETLTYIEMQDRLAQQYLRFSDLYHVAVAPIGKVWEETKEKYPNYSLYYDDDYHQNKLGSFLIASTFYNMIFNTVIQDFTSIPYFNLSEKEVRDIATLSANIVLRSDSDWRITNWDEEEFKWIDYQISDNHIQLSTNIPEDWKVKWKVNGEKVSTQDVIQLSPDQTKQRIEVVVKKGLLRRNETETAVISQGRRVKHVEE